MLGRVWSIGIALAVAAAGVVAVPAGGVHAEYEPVAIIKPNGGNNGVVGCLPGRNLYLDGTPSYDPLGNEGDGRIDYSWSWPGGTANGRDVSIPCDFPAEIEVMLTVTTRAGSGTATVRVKPNLKPTAVISLDGKPLEGEVYLEVGSTVTLSAGLSSDPEGGPLGFKWLGPKDRLTGDVENSTIQLTCDDRESVVSVGLYAVDEYGEPDEEYGVSNSDFVDRRALDVICISAPVAAVTPAPAGPGKRTKIPLGTTITFETEASGFSSVAWRTTGVPGVASTDRYTFTREFDAVGDFGVQLTETNPLGSSSKWAGYTVVAPPTVSVTPAPPGLTDRMTVVAGSKITFDGSGTRSPGGAALTFAWRTTGQPGVVSDSNSYARSFDTPGDYGVELTVTDELGQKSKRWVGLTVVSADPPVVRVTPAPADPTGRMTVDLGATVTFDGSGSISPGGATLTYQWRTTGKPGVVATGTTYARKFDALGNFGVELTVIDSNGQTAKRWVGVTVQR